MQNTKHLLREIGDQRHEAFAKPLKWYRRKQTYPYNEVLHLNKNCTHIPKNQEQGFGRIDLVLHEAFDTRQICGICVDPNLLYIPQRRVYHAAKQLADIAERIHAGLGCKTSFPNLRSQQDWHRQALMQMDLSAADLMDDLPQWKRRLETELDARRLTPVGRHQLDAETLHWAATEMFGQDIVVTSGLGAKEEFCSQDGQEIFGWPAGHDGFSRSHEHAHPIVLLVREWTTLLREGTSPQIAASTLLADPGLVTRIAGKTTYHTLLYGLYQRRQNEAKWEQAALEAVAQILALWTAYHEKLTAPTEPVLFRYEEEDTEAVADRRRRDRINNPDSIWAMIRESLDWITSQNDRIAICHPTVGRYLCWNFLHLNSVPYADPIQLTEWPTRENVIDACTLWTHGATNSVYGRLEDALKAAKLL